MEKNNNQNRTGFILIRVSEEEKRAIRVTAAMEGKSMAEYIRTVAVREGEKNNK